MPPKKPISFPVNWRPYPYQVPLWNYLESGGKRAIAVWHRRAGKDIVGLNWITAAALCDPGVYWYVFPTEEQAKTTIWDGMTLEGRPYLSYIPEGLVSWKSASTLRIEFKNGSLIQFVGASAPSRLRGAGIKGAVLSEYSFQNPKAFLAVIQPMMVRSNGWLLFLYTPSDDPKKNHGEDIYRKSLGREGYFVERLTIEETADHEGNPLVRVDQLEALRVEGMTEAQIRREFYCDFEAYKYTGIQEGSTFGASLRQAEAEGRIADVPYNPAYKVNTYWDVGIVDYTAIWFVQETAEFLNVIDFFVSRGKDMEFYLNHLRLRPYEYGKNVLPHDMGRRQVPMLDTRLSQCNEIAKKLCFDPFHLGLRYQREEMIGKTREFLNYCRIDARKCHSGIQGLYEFDASKRTTHSSSTRATDIAEAFCYMAMDAKTNAMREQIAEGLRSLKSKKTVSEYDILEF
jgi:phage terminase large subunit